MRDVMKMVTEFTDRISKVRPVPLKSYSDCRWHDAAMLEKVAIMLQVEAKTLLETYLRDGYDVRSLRAHLIVEEVSEVLRALARVDEVQLLDGLADLTYVVAGTAVAFNLPLPEAIEEVHRSNMTKTPSDGEDGGRVLNKGVHYDPPRLKALLEVHVRGYSHDHTGG